ncbi:MAG: DNA polymerase III subunit delta' [Pseudomonadota bacterium]
MSEEALPIPSPRETADLVGQSEAEARLLAASQSGRLPHAWLISGPAGIGKATLAYRMARFLLAGEQGGDLFGGPPSDLTVAPDHPAARRIAAGAHPDLMSVERGYDEKRKRFRNEIVVEDVRAVNGFLRMTPAEGGWRIVVIDSADELNRNAANALLKILEEPPSAALLLLISHAPGRLLATIRSRCCQLPLRPLQETQVEAMLARLAPDLTAAQCATLAGLAEGSIGRALALQAAGGLALHEQVMALVGGLPRLDVPALHGFADKVSRGSDPQTFRMVGEMLRGWLAERIRARALAGAEERRRLADWLALWEKTNGLFARAESANLDRKQVVITAFLDLQALAS